MSTNVTSRPRQHDESVIAAVAAKLVEPVMQALGEKPSEQGRKEILSDLAEMLDDKFDWEGYALAKWLDNEKGYRVDSHFVDILDHASHYAQTETERLTKEWVTAQQLKPRYDVGDSVRFSGRKGIEQTGTIISVNRTTLTYIVFVPGKGHIGFQPSGSRETGTVGIHVNDEDALGLAE